MLNACAAQLTARASEAYALLILFMKEEKKQRNWKINKRFVYKQFRQLANRVAGTDWNENVNSTQHDWYVWDLVCVCVFF